MMTEEQYCYQMLAELRKSYERDAKPYIDRLVAIKSMQPASRIVLTLDQAREFVDFTMSAPPDCGEAGTLKAAVVTQRVYGPNVFYIGKTRA